MKTEKTLLILTENIEMELFSTDEPYLTPVHQTEEDTTLNHRYREHPLVHELVDDKPDQQVRTESKPQTESSTMVPSFSAEELWEWNTVPGFMEDLDKEIEMKVFPSARLCQRESETIVTQVTPVACPNKTRRKWRKLTPQRTGLVVKDIICLPQEHLAHIDSVSLGNERSTLASARMTARITIDYGWSAHQMENRLVAHFRERLLNCQGQGLSFTYLQCMQGSNVPFIPIPPGEGWTGEQVLRIAGHGPLYIVCCHDYPQDKAGWPTHTTPKVNCKEFCLEASTESCPDEENQSETQSFATATEEFTLDLDTILQRFRHEHMDHEVETHVHVRRRAVLRGAMKAVKRPDFYYRATPIIRFAGEDTEGHEGPLREFFRLALLELQHSSVFEGHQGRLFLTYDLTALENRKYYDAGVLIGWSLTQGGPGPHCLHPALYQLMCAQNLPLEQFDCRDIADVDVQIRLQQLQSCTRVELLPASLCDWVASCGIPGIYTACSVDLPAIYTRLVKHYIYHRVASMISQFTEGLDSCGGLWDIMKFHCEAFAPLMTSAHQRPLGLKDFTQLFAVCYSCPESPLRAAEETTVGQWERVLTMINDGQTDFSFEDLLAFITGANHIPPLGFNRAILLRFFCQFSALTFRLPHASTCALELFLPRGVTSTDKLSTLLGRAVHETLGFGHIQPETK